ncbi:MAG TPA: PaaI family thioesterase [Caulobacteraceae bacterium]|nr:PaaI family thioesterase [Caulobacteraceae bacterium]
MIEPHPILAVFQAASGPLKMTDPISSLLNGEIVDLDPETGSALLAFAPDERFKQGGGIIHGGIVSTMLDTVLALAAFTRLRAGQSFATVSLTTHFLRQALPGRHLASARLDRMGARMIFASGELRREGEDTPLATATAVMAMTRT